MNYTVERANRYIKNNKEKVNPQFRQKIHAQPPIGWMNDPNGFIAINDKLHLFYQFYPYDSVWGPMHWGHMTSTDGLTWQDQPVALAPDHVFDEKGCFSGTAVLVDNQLILMYTGCEQINGQAIQQQCIATSTNFKDFDKSTENPVISTINCPSFISAVDFRDPKIIYRKGRYYALIVTKTPASEGQIVLFESLDCKEWNFKSILLTGNKELGIMWECPDLLTIDGKDILILSAIEMPSQKEKFTNLSSCIYFVGNMNWETGQYSYDYYEEIDAGLDFYAPQMTIFKNKPVLISWMQMWDRNIPTHELNHLWAGCMTSVRQLSIENGQLIQRPLTHSITDKLFLKTNMAEIIPLNTQPKYLKIEFVPENNFNIQFQNKIGEILSLKKEGTFFTLSREKMQTTILGKEKDFQNYRIYDSKGMLRENFVEIILDTSSIEVFIGNGQKTMSMRFFPTMPLSTCQIIENE
ncbi:beta-fructofuranosidase [Enterococcus sp. DIV2402]|uniref:beta-fructofuranosidase n=1 Tax=Candidatus Enterococcus lowellii TaxID=2230877 RepID=A0ABZ2SQ07_9ENTE|nr:GH32 C-terminal domain-containing protein [Enterococcus sp. DIV2402]MBO0465772.1 glycoside hydrolase family 32 protein [Enterococcus sp. DIV2402]